MRANPHTGEQVLDVLGATVPQDDDQWRCALALVTAGTSHQVGCGADEQEGIGRRAAEAAAQFLSHHFLADAVHAHEEDARQGLPIVDPWPTALGLRPYGWQQVHNHS